MGLQASRSLLLFSSRQDDENRVFLSLTYRGDGGVIFETGNIQRMETLILGALQWRMRSITPFSFIPFFLALCQPQRPSFQAEIKLLEFKPSIIAASALLSASHELFPFQYPSFFNAITDCAYESILKCNNVIQDIAMEGYESIFDLVSSSETPIMCLDLTFQSSESEKTNGTTATAITQRQENDMKEKENNYVM
ncbi:putative cyclin-D6-1 [Senna tora]|uniref:Putative cyclin-D6-1 n=1 Tax=Senna tora TaxID=362788 RepID=A0A834SLE6_9FABA|nr:putative cyclin-D6-1 [Senna tora]